MEVGRVFRSLLRERRRQFVLELKLIDLDLNEFIEKVAVN
jgi:hypothetical protein